MTNIKNQHYVWRHYLKPWINDSKIWCIRETKVFNINPEKIAKDDYFYAADPLNTNEKQLIDSFIKMAHPTGQPLLKQIHEIYLLSSYSSEYLRKNAIEKYHSTIESGAISTLDKLYFGDLSFWEDTDIRNNFSYFIGLQYTRTKRQTDGVEKAFNLLKSHPEYPDNINPKKIAKVMSLLMGEFIGNWLSSQAIPVLIMNKSAIGFLTSDQPVFNLYADFSDTFTPPTQFKLYYPIAPDKALLFRSKDEHGENDENLNFDSLNQFIIKASREYVFADSKELFKRYFSNTI